MKVRLLNGTHSLIAYLGALSGESLIAASVARAEIERAARAVIGREYGPSVRMPKGIDGQEYEQQLFERWGNSALGHRTAQVGTDGSVKLRQRIPGPVIQALGCGRFPHLIALCVAGYLACIAPLPGFEPGPDARAMADAARGDLTALASTARDGRELAHRVIVERQLFGAELAARPDFADRVGELLDTIRRHGVTAAIQEALEASDTEAAENRKEQVR
jgi:fructuronate reductase